jgi:glycerophosphoryl diester phosphodiesterase
MCKNFGTNQYKYMGFCGNFALFFGKNGYLSRLCSKYHKLLIDTYQFNHYNDFIERETKPMSFPETRDEIIRRKEKNKILIAAHRGTCGGYIIPNTIPAFENSLKHGSDIIEVDAVMSTDGDFFAFHNGKEKAVLGIEKDIRTLSTQEIASLRCFNSDGTQINQRLDRLDDILEQFKGRCLINIDRSWFYWEEMIQCIERHPMPDQIILKSHVDPQLLKVLEAKKVEFMYMPIISTPAQIEEVLKYRLNLLGLELIFRNLDNPLIQEERMQSYHSRRILTWVNTITLDDDMVLSGLLDDFRAITGSEQDTWGRLINMGFDILQTDWPLLLRKFVEESVSIRTHETGMTD